MRIFIDCTLVDFSRQPTGIPRVVMNYINVGYEWAKKRPGVEIIPCVPSREGMYVCRPVPGIAPPQYLMDRVAASESTTESFKYTDALEALAGYFAGLAASLVGVASAVVPTAGNKDLHKSIADKLGAAATSLGRRRLDDNTSPILIKPEKGDVVFCPAYWHDVDPEIYRIMKRNGASIVILVHDILPISFEKYYPAPWKYDFKNSVIQTASYADALYCVSNYTKDSLKEFLLRQRTSLPVLKTAYNGFEPLVSEEGLSLIKDQTNTTHFGNRQLTEMARQRNPYIMVGSVEPKKGHIPTVRCFEMMWDAGLARDLVIVGRKGWMDGEITRTIEGSSYYGKRLFWHSNIDDFDLADLYVHSRALIFASVAEGFGIPMVEAAHYGMPTIVYESPIAREVIGDYGSFFDDAASLVEHVMNFETEDGYRQARERVSDFKWHSWEECAPEVFDSLVKIVKRNH